MPNINDLQRFLKVEMVQNGDLIHFCDAGSISQKEFKSNPGKKKPVLEMEVMIGDTMKKISYSPNSTSVKLLSEAWGPNTETWVGKTGIVVVVDQISFGELTKILIVKPHSHMSRNEKDL